MKLGEQNSYVPAFSKPAFSASPTICIHLLNYVTAKSLKAAIDLQSPLERLRRHDWVDRMILYSCLLGPVYTITVIPPTQGSRKNTVRVRNITQESTRFAYILRYITSLHLC